MLIQLDTVKLQPYVCTYMCVCVRVAACEWCTHWATSLMGKWRSSAQILSCSVSSESQVTATRRQQRESEESPHVWHAIAVARRLVHLTIEGDLPDLGPSHRLLLELVHILLNVQHIIHHGLRGWGRGGGRMQQGRMCRIQGVG